MLNAVCRTFLLSTVHCSLPTAFRRLNPEDLAVKSAVIIPLIHVARNVRRGDGKTQDLILVSLEKGAQAPERGEILQLPAKARVNPDRVPAATLIFGDDETYRAALACFYQGAYHCGRDGGLVRERHEQATSARPRLFHAQRNGDAHFTFRVVVDCETNRKMSQTAAQLSGARAREDDYHLLDAALD
jgi:hypothetical protein